MTKDTYQYLLEKEDDKRIEELYRLTIRFIYGEIEGEELDLALLDYVKKENDYKSRNAKNLFEKFSSIVDATKGTILYYYILTFLLHATNSIELCKTLLLSVMNQKEIAGEDLYFFFQYVSRLRFLGILPQNREIDELCDDLYLKMVCEFSNVISQDIEFIQLCDRDEQLVIMLTGQMLSMEHGPTKTLMDRCFILQKHLGKKILIVNTAEMSRFTTDYPVFGFRKGNYLDAYNSVKSIEYQECKFDYMQCNNDRNYDLDINRIIKILLERRPYCVVSIGGGSVIADLCSKVVPVITVGTVPSARTQTYSQFQTIGRKVNEDDLKWLEKHQMEKEHFIESLFTSAFKEQNHHYSRKDLGLPQDGFIAVLVGSRLDDEVDDSCLELLIRLMEKGIYIAFAGRFNRFEELSKDVSLFGNQGIDLGFQNDMLAVFECCDICINPKRVGGGTSVAEALYKQIPVITLNYGDGGLGAGDDFCLKSYDQMYDMALRLYQDRSFYQLMQKKAANRAEALMDSKKEFIRIMEIASDRAAFQ